MNSNCCQPNQTSCGCEPAAESAAQSTDRKVPTYLPSVDVVETPESLVITADVPGATPQSVDVTFEDDTLTLRAGVATPADDTRRAVHREYGVGDYLRTFTINQPIDREHISAALADGVLTVTLPKSAAARPRKISIQPGQN